MPLPRLHIATSVMDEFIDLHTGEQRLLVYLMARRSMRKLPFRPSNYFTYADIAEDLHLSETTIRLYIQSLKKERWIQEISRQRVEGELRLRWTFPKLDEAWEATYANETEHEFESYAAEAEANGWLLLEDTFWRAGGELGYQHRGVNKRFWAESSNPPDAVVNFFSNDSIESAVRL